MQGEKLVLGQGWELTTPTNSAKSSFQLSLWERLNTPKNRDFWPLSVLVGIDGLRDLFHLYGFNDSEAFPVWV